MKPIGSILDELSARADCVFFPSKGLPQLPVTMTIPGDLVEFYSRFSEARIFVSADDRRYRILPPAKFEQIGVAVYGDQSCTPLQDSWYSLVDVHDGNYFAIDCSSARNGLCYDVFHETACELDYCRVIAQSFTELMNVIATEGDKAWWLADEFKGYGYADQLD